MHFSPLDDVSYEDCLQDLSQKWLLIELAHRTSKTASDEFWLLAREAFSKLHRAKLDDMVYKPIPQFTSQRKKLYNNHVPTIHMEIGYLNKETNETVVVFGDKTPVSRFNPQRFQKIYEVASVEVILYDLKKK